MGKGKPRHNPEKQQNKWSGDERCAYFDGYTPSGSIICEGGVQLPKCNGNRHNCIKEKYRLLAAKGSK